MKFLIKNPNLEKNRSREDLLHIILHPNRIIILFLILIMMIIIFINSAFLRKAISSKATAQEGKLQTESHRKRMSLLKSFPIQEWYQKLEEQVSFPNEELEKEGIFLASPVNMCLDQRGNINISDHKDNSIKKFSPEGNFLYKIGTAGQAPGELLKPLFVCTDNKNNLFVYDTGNSRIQVFKPEREFLSSFKIFKAYISMAVTRQGHILLSPYTSDLKEPLIEVLNKNGNLINSFGERIKFKHNTIAHNEIFISLNNKDEVFIAWRNFPIVRRFSKEGKLLSEYKVNYKLVKELAKSNYKMKMVK